MTVRQLHVDRPLSDDDVRALASSIGLGQFRTSARRGLRGRVLLFDHGLVERRGRTLTCSVDEDSTVLDATAHALHADLRRIAV